jgi:hypothetical protein
MTQRVSEVVDQCIIRDASLRLKPTTPSARATIMQQPLLHDLVDRSPFQLLGISVLASLIWFLLFFITVVEWWDRPLVPFAADSGHSGCLEISETLHWGIAGALPESVGID